MALASLRSQNCLGVLEEQDATMIAALVLAAMLDPNCLPRHHAHRSRSQAFVYQPRYYHAPPPPACREPWPEAHLHDIGLRDLPYSPVSRQPPDIGHSPAVIWPGFVPNPPVQQPHGGAPASRPPVGVPEPATLGLFAVGAAALLVRRRPCGWWSQVARSGQRGAGQ